MQQQTDPFSKQLRERLVGIERQDWQLWVLALAMLAILTAGFFAVLLPAVFLGQRSIEINASISPQLLLGLLVLIMMFIVYLIRQNLRFRTLRTQSIAETWNFEITRAQSLMDPLTKVLTRAALEEILSREILRVKRAQSSLVFLYVDVNDFKRVNSRFGHLTGDLVLAEVGGILKRCVRGSDYVIRMGGDEFLAALVDTDLPGAEVVKQRIICTLEEWNQNSPLRGFEVSLSIGVQQFDGARTLDEVLADADFKMYAEKRSPPDA